MQYFRNNLRIVDASASGGEHEPMAIEAPCWFMPYTEYLAAVISIKTGKLA